MNRISLYSYDPKNWEQIVGEIASQDERIKIFSSQELNAFNVIKKSLGEDKDANVTFLFDDMYFDFSMVMAGDGDRVDLWSGSLISVLTEFFNTFKGNISDKFFVVDKKYAKDIVNVLYYYFDEVKSLEKEFGIDKRTITNIVDIDDTTLTKLEEHLNKHLFGNRKFKIRLLQELKRFRLFNKLGERKIFSAFVCGPSGIGKTLTAKLLHDCLAPEESYIKINLGNYSDHSALSSLIGSPRGYIGSSKGELSGKINESKSTIILIDEFEKASQEVHNFFLELLADGRFTDSQGREYDLNKYIIIFTSNISENDFQTKISPELRSRFDLVYRMVLLNDEEKIAYAEYKINYFIEQVKKKLNVDISSEKIMEDIRQKILKLNNVRAITKEIEQRVAMYVEESGIK